MKITPHEPVPAKVVCQRMLQRCLHPLEVLIPMGAIAYPGKAIRDREVAREEEKLVFPFAAHPISPKPILLSFPLE